MKRIIIVWTDFPILQFFIKMSERGEPTRTASQIQLGREAPFGMTMSTKLSAYGLNIQHNCSDEIMSGTSFSDPQEGQALARIYRIGQTRSSRAQDDMAKADVEYSAEISNPDGADSAEKIQTVVEKSWGS
ncbi:hypothetical protein EAE99_008316 [Botrytis elliptica]|nr:hypothetical protein EAE99_008316 [Botrytis elliptica]